MPPDDRPRRHDHLVEPLFGGLIEPGPPSRGRRFLWPALGLALALCALLWWLAR